MINPNMMQINQARIADISEAANRARIAHRAASHKADRWHRMIGYIGRGMVQSGESLLRASGAAHVARQTATYSAIKSA